jgi:hypothetical protein
VPHVGDHGSVVRLSIVVVNYDCGIYGGYNLSMMVVAIVNK